MINPTELLRLKLQSMSNIDYVLYRRELEEDKRKSQSISKFVKNRGIGKSALSKRINGAD